jgi:large subunit ribosomal protein L2
MKNSEKINKNSETLSYKFLLKKKPLLKFKLKGLTNSAGRNNQGKITSYHKGGGHKKKYREINFRRIENSKGIVCSIEYDPNRNTNIASIYDNIKKKFFYIIAPKNLNIGDIVESGNNIEPKLGNSLFIENIPVGTFIHNVAPTVKHYSQISRSAGTFSKIKEKTLNYALIELSSGEQRILSPKCYATIGVVSNESSFLKKFYKAGQMRWLNKRPTVRGVAMNPVDHPHGGGEGKKSGINKTPWGKFNIRGLTSRSKNKNIFKKRK